MTQIDWTERYSDDAQVAAWCEEARRMIRAEVHRRQEDARQWEPRECPSEP